MAEDAHGIGLKISSYGFEIVHVVVNALGMIQSVFRYIALPLILIGILLALRTNWRSALLILCTVVYYLLALAVGHSEIRYGLPMQSLLLVFAAFCIHRICRIGLGSNSG